MNVDGDLKLVGDEDDDLDVPPELHTPEGSDDEGEGGSSTLLKPMTTPGKRKRKAPSTPHKDRQHKKKPYKPRAKKVREE